MTYSLRNISKKAAANFPLVNFICGGVCSYSEIFIFTSNFKTLLKNPAVYIDKTLEQSKLYYEINLHLDCAFPMALKDVTNTD